MTTRKPLSPIDIQSNEFRRAFRGYDREEVRLFLQAVAESYQALTLENHKLLQEIENLRAGLDDFKRRENVLRDALYTAQKMSDEIRAQAVREAECTVQEAHVKAEGLHQQAQLRAQQVERNILDLKLERETLVMALKDLTQRVRSLLDGVEEAKAKENVTSFSKENS
jgi:cell division initiation protein